MKKLYIYSIFVLIVSVGCSNPSFPLFEETQVVQFTALVSTQTVSPTYLVYIDENFSKQKIILSDSLKNENRIEIRLRKNQLTPILVYSGDEDAQPYGCMYPLSTTISEKDGFSAWILYKLLVSSRESPKQVYNFISRFNWTRFDSYIQKRENPWLLNQELILENIADGTFNVYSIKNK